MQLKETILLKIYQFTAKYGVSLLFAIITGLAGFLAGMFGNVISDPNIKTIENALMRMFDLESRPINILNWVCLIAIALAILFIPFLPRVAQSWRRKQSYEGILAIILQGLKDKSLMRLNTIVVGQAITLQKCPEMERGWLASEIEINHKPSHFRLPTEYDEMYNEYFEKVFLKKHGNDGGKTIMLSELPIAWTDRPKLLLNTKTNSYSYSQFYWHRIISDPDKYNLLFNRLFDNGDTEFPHNLCLHLVVITNDNKVLLTLRSKKVGSDANTWSCSIEENLKEDDIKGQRSLAVTRWMKRAIFEELGLSDNAYSENNLKILAVFLEGNRMNISLVGLVTLDLNQEDLSQILAALPRNDYEFVETAYLTLHELAEQLIKPSRNYHPTSGYRILMTLLHLYGEPDFARRFIGLLNSNNGIIKT